MIAGGIANIAQVAELAATQQIPLPLNDPDLFTASPRWRDFIRNDRLALHQATARLLVESVRLDRYVRRAARHVTIPTLLLLAGQDRIIRNDRGSIFLLCERALTDPTFPKYPRLPVLECRGYERKPED